MSTSPDLPPPAGPQTPAALVIDDLPPPPKPPLFMPQSQWDLMKMTLADAQDYKRWSQEVDIYSKKVAQHVSNQITKIITKIITDLEGSPPETEELLAHVVRISVQPMDRSKPPADLYHWKGQAILRTEINWQLTEAHPSPTMNLEILV